LASSDAAVFVTGKKVYTTGVAEGENRNSGGFMAGDRKEPEYAVSFDKYRSHTTETTAALIRSVLRYVPSSPGARIIDIGCGTGRYALPLARATGVQVFATDLSWAMAGKGRAKDTAKDVSWSLSDACRIPFVDETFDAAFLFLVLHVVKDPRKALREAYRILRPGGHCLILAHTYSQMDRQTVLSFFPEARKLNKRRMLSLTKAKDLVRELGFHHLRTEEFAESVTYARDAFLEKIRSKPNSSLRLISDAAFERSYRTLEAAVAGQETCTEQTFSTLLVMRK
jgi:ubiquinone/menaquinone biosynthesis C-methylase UbiE